ncbi:hypothetical protein ACLPHN_12980, partial [Pseudomonas aeruginosa]
MSVDLHALIPLIALTFLLAGFVKGVVGLGLPTVSVVAVSLKKGGGGGGGGGGGRGGGGGGGRGGAGG